MNSAVGRGQISNGVKNRSWFRHTPRAINGHRIRMDAVAETPPPTAQPRSHKKLTKIKLKKLKAVYAKWRIYARRVHKLLCLAVCCSDYIRLLQLLYYSMMWALSEEIRRERSATTVGFPPTYHSLLHQLLPSHHNFTVFKYLINANVDNPRYQSNAMVTHVYVKLHAFEANGDFENFDFSIWMKPARAVTLACTYGGFESVQVNLGFHLLGGVRCFQACLRRVKVCTAVFYGKLLCRQSTHRRICMWFSRSW